MIHVFRSRGGRVDELPLDLGVSVATNWAGPFAGGAGEHQLRGGRAFSEREKERKVGTVGNMFAKRREISLSNSPSGLRLSLGLVMGALSPFLGASSLTLPANSPSGLRLSCGFLTAALSPLVAE